MEHAHNPTKERTKQRTKQNAKVDTNVDAQLYPVTKNISQE